MFSFFKKMVNKVEKGGMVIVGGVATVARAVNQVGEDFGSDNSDDDDELKPMFSDSDSQMAAMAGMNTGDVYTPSDDSI